MTRRDDRSSASKWLSPEQVCDRVPGLTVTLLSRLRDAGKGPRYYKPTKKTVIYRASDIDDWIEASAVPTREQP